ncbi:MAG: hypothetical protein WC140_07175 [Bacteroidales bacterium]
MSKLLKTILYVLLGISAVILVLFFIQSSTGQFDLANLGTIMASTNMVDGIIWWAYILLAIAFLSVVILSIIGLFKDSKSLKSFVIILIIAIVIVGISYLLASGAPVNVNIDTPPSASTLKWTDTGLIVTYILFGFAILSLIVGGIVNSIKNR